MELAESNTTGLHMDNSAQNARLRDSVQTLLAAGNSPESVANVLELSIADLKKLREMPAPSSSDALGTSIQAVTSEYPPRMLFHSDLIYQSPISLRITYVICGLALIFISVAIPFWDKTTLPHQMISVLLPMWLFMGPVGIWMILQARCRLVLGRVQVKLHSELSVERLNYSDIAEINYTKAVVHARGGPYLGHRLTLRSKSLPRREISIFIWDRYPMSAAVWERLNEISLALNRHKLTRL